jgi:hypothetical protein
MWHGDSDGECRMCVVGSVGSAHQVTTAHRTSTSTCPGLSARVQANAQACLHHTGLYAPHEAEASVLWGGGEMHGGG